MTVATDRYGRGWSREEIAAAVDAYLQMLRRQNSGHQFAKVDVVNELLTGPLSGRTRKAIEFRFCNISAVLSERSLPIVAGFRPLAHVGMRHRTLIAELIAPELG